jgi:hypothetical protein
MLKQDPSDCALEFIYSAYNAAINDPDTLTWSEAMRAPDSEQFKHSAQVEIKALHDAGTWEVVEIKPRPPPKSCLAYGYFSTSAIQVPAKFGSTKEDIQCVGTYKKANSTPLPLSSNGPLFASL